MEELIAGHLAIMDRYDPDKHVQLLVDEWGTWYDVEKGTNPGFLYQQNTMRDALVASLTLDIFAGHADRLGLCCIAQMVNVLQAMVLTDGADMFLTPTYHVFSMYKAHQEADLVPSFVFADTVGGVKQVSASASKKGDTVTLSLSNLHATEPIEVLIDAAGMEKATAEGVVLTGRMDAHNTFDKPENVKPAVLEGIRTTKRGLLVTLPACAVATLTLKA
ncbi:MAG: hypothetical protein IJ708_12280 [Clostridia bacterium]|nr:hypothetical protein [Clostridia bacterium]